MSRRCRRRRGKGRRTRPLPRALEIAEHQAARQEFLEDAHPDLEFVAGWTPAGFLYGVPRETDDASWLEPDDVPF